MQKLPDRGEYAVKPPNGASLGLVYRVNPLNLTTQRQLERQLETWFGRCVRLI